MNLIITNLHIVINLALLFLLLCTAIAITMTKNLLSSTILLGVFSMLMATEYLVLGAPDVAITEASVGSCISTIFLLLAIFMVGDREKKSQHNKLVPFVLSALVFVILIYVTFEIPTFGSALTPAAKHVSEYYLEYSMRDTEVANVVTSILASYRGFDTFGELLVVFTSSVAVLMLLGKIVTKNNRD